jgi:hypothetical protein
MSNPTSNFNWQMPTATDLVTDLPADFEVFGQAVDSSMADLLGGTTGQVLAKNSNTNMDFVWTSLSSPAVINPNLVINGNFTINQRGYVSAANLASGAYGFDRWKSNFTNTTLTFTSAPAGQTVTINSGGGLQQIVEQANVPAGTYVLSFAGTATGRIYNSGATPPSYAASPISFTADGLANVVVEFTATGGTKTLGEVKLEEGSSATGYNYSGGTIQGELAACQRYYYQISATNNSYTRFGNGITVATSQAHAGVKMPVTMRTAPTLVATATASNYVIYTGSNFTLTSVPTIDQTTPDFVVILCFTSASQTINAANFLAANNTTAALLGFNSEL